MSPRPTLKTIAEMTGLAVPTISRALGDAPDISPGTKERVQRVAREIGYVPNRTGLRLRTGRTQVISVVISTDSELMNLTARLIGSIAAALKDTRYHLNITPYFPDEDPLAPIRYIVETGSADAVIFNQIEPDDARVDYLLKRRFPFATHGRSNRAAEHAWFDFDNRAFAVRGIRQLVDRQRRHLLHIAPPLNQTYARHMIDGAQAAARESGAALTIADTITSDSSIDAIRGDVRQRAERDKRIDGILVGSPNAAMAAIAGMEAAGRVIGEDFDVVAKDAINFLPLFRRQIQIIYEDVSEAGRFLARAAIHAIDHPQEPPMQHLDAPSP